MSTRPCPGCRADNRLDAHFCRACGQSLGQAATKSTLAHAIAPSLDSAPAAPRQTPEPPPSRPRANSSNTTLYLSTAAGAVVGLLVLTIVVFAATGGDVMDSEELSTATSAPTVPAPTVVSTVATTSTTDAPTTTLTPTTAGPRPGTLYSTFATIRREPILTDATEITVIEDRRGSALDILEGPERGWYRVRIDGIEGWLWGSFVLPPDPGHLVAETLSGDRAVLRDSAGFPLPRQNESGDTVLVVDDSGPLWEVLLADGASAFVQPAEMRVVQ